MDKPSRILVIQLKRAGDVIVTTPVLAALKQTFPGTVIDFLVDIPFAPLLRHHPALRQVRIYDRSAPWKTVQALRRERYDWVLDFQSSPRSILATLFIGARMRAGYRVRFWGHFLSRAMRRPGADVSATEGKMNLVRTLWPEVAKAGERMIYLTSQERDWALEVSGSRGSAKSPIGLIPTHRRSSRRWLPEHFVALGQRLRSAGHPLWLFWGPGEESYVQDIQRQIPESWMIPKTSLREMAALLERCEVVITNDNGPMHTASAVGAPTVTLYGPTDPVCWNPGGPRHRVLRASALRCLGCNLNECPFDHECMRLLTPERVAQEAASLLSVAARVLP